MANSAAQPFKAKAPRITPVPKAMEVQATGHKKPIATLTPSVIQTGPKAGAIVDPIVGKPKSKSHLAQQELAAADLSGPDRCRPKQALERPAQIF